MTQTTYRVLPNNSFCPDYIVRSPRVQDELPLPEFAHGLMKHFNGDWGDVAANTREENDRNLAQHSGRLLSAFRAKSGLVFWVVTELGWCWTAVLTPEEFPEYQAMLAGVRELRETVQ